MDRTDLKRLIREKIKQNKNLINNNKLLLKHINSMHSLEEKAERIAKLSLLVSFSSVVIAVAAWFIPFEVNKHQNFVESSKTLLVHLGNLKQITNANLLSGCNVSQQTKEDLLKSHPNLLSTFGFTSAHKNISMIYAMSLSVSDKLLSKELNNFLSIYSLNIERSDLIQLSEWYEPKELDYSNPDGPKVTKYGSEVPLVTLADFYSSNMILNIYISYLMQAIQLSIQDNLINDEYELYLKNSNAEMLELRLRLYEQFKFDYKNKALRLKKCKNAFQMANRAVYTFLKTKG